jgi:inner membrane protein YhjD
VANPLERPVAQAKLRLERARARHGLVDIVVRVFKRFSETDGGTYSAALTYYTFFSIFPLLAVAAAVLGFITQGNADQQQDIFERGVDAFPMLKDALRPEGFRAIEQARQELALTGGLLALYAGSGAIVALEHALNKVHRIEEEPNFWEKRLRSFKWLAVLGVAFLVSIGLNAYGAVQADGSDIPGDVFGWVLRILAVTLSVGVFATAFKFLPAKKQPWTEVLPGAIAGGIAFGLLLFLGGLFVSAGQGSRNATFGAFAAAATLLVVCFLGARLTLLAAEVNAVLAERRLTRQPAVSEEGGSP